MALPGRKANSGVLGLLLVAGLFAGNASAGASGVQHAQRNAEEPAPATAAKVPAAESGEPAKSSNPWVAPTRGEISSVFGMRWGAMHNGVDIANEVGTPIRAASGGTVVDSGPASGYGLWVRIDHGHRIVTTYGHVHETLVAKDQKIESGQLVATLGNRGNSTGPHLHFQVDIEGEPVDPVRFYGSPEALTDWPRESANS